VVILSKGRLVAEHQVSAFGTAGGPTLEDTFVQVTQQPDFTPVAREIIETIRTS
jgi:hypothetical protein